MFSVHATKVGEVGAVEIVFRDEREARRFAKDRSRDWRVMSTSVTSFVIGELGTRHPVAWYAKGEEQPPRFHGPERQFYPRTPATARRPDRRSLHRSVDVPVSLHRR